MELNLMIKKLRKGKGLTQEQLAEQMGVSVMTMRRWEWGQASPNAKLLSDLADKLGTTTEELLKSTDNKDTDVSVSYTKEQSHNQGMATFISKNGERFEVPATPEGYAFLRDMASRDLVIA